MSFILDALRKSEAERRREAAPSLSHAPLAIRRRDSPLWTRIVIAILAIALAALALAWWRSDRGAVRTAQDPPRETSPALPSGDALRAAPAAAGAGQSTVPAASADAATTGSAGNGAGEPAAEPLPIAELALADPALPALRLEFLAFSGADPGSSSAWINGSLYRPGERLPGGIELVEVRPDSVVVAYRGQRYLLRTR